MAQATFTRILVIVTAALIAVLSSSCRRNHQAPAERAAQTVDEFPLSSVATEIQRRGYRVVQRPISSATAWEIANFRTRDRHVVSFKADQPLPNARDYYVRFLLIEETFVSEADAERRLSDLHLKVPDRFDNEYELAMREGFRIGMKTYILQTDALVFWEEIKKLGKELLDSADGGRLE